MPSTTPLISELSALLFHLSISFSVILFTHAGTVGSNSSVIPLLSALLFQLVISLSVIDEAIWLVNIGSASSDKKPEPAKPSDILLSTYSLVAGW